MSDLSHASCPQPLSERRSTSCSAPPAPTTSSDGEVSDDTLRRLYDLLKWGPTSANMSPARFVFVKSQEAKAKLGPALDEGNYAKTMAAPVTVIVAYDVAFYEKLPYLFPHADAKSWFDSTPRDRAGRPSPCATAACRAPT